MNKLILLAAVALLTGCATLDDALYTCNKQCNQVNKVVDNVKIDRQNIICSCKQPKCEVNYNE